MKVEEEKIIGSIMNGYGHRGWVNYPAGRPDYHRKRMAAALMNRARQALLERDYPKMNLQVRAGNISQSSSTRTSDISKITCARANYVSALTADFGPTNPNKLPFLERQFVKNLKITQQSLRFRPDRRALGLPRQPR